MLLNTLPIADVLGTRVWNALGNKQGVVVSIQFEKDNLQKQPVDRVRFDTVQINWGNGKQSTNFLHLLDLKVVSTGGVLFRPCCGSLEDAISKAWVFPSILELSKFLSTRNWAGLPMELITQKYGDGVDLRIGWDTYIVTADGYPQGYISGPEKPLEVLKYNKLLTNESKTV